MSDPGPAAGKPAAANDGRVTLIDGREVSSSSEEWRHECEARYLLSMGLEDRRAMLYGPWVDVFVPGQKKKQERKGGIRQKRGQEAVDRLEATLTEMWKLRRNAA